MIPFCNRCRRIHWVDEVNHHQLGGLGSPAAGLNKCRHIVNNKYNMSSYKTDDNKMRAGK